MQSSLKRRSIYFIGFCSNFSTISTHLSESRKPVNKDGGVKEVRVKVAIVVGEVLAMRLKVKGLVSSQERGIHVDVDKELEKKDFENRTKVWAVISSLKNNDVKLIRDEDIDASQSGLLLDIILPPLPFSSAATFAQNHVPSAATAIIVSASAKLMFWLGGYTGTKGILRNTSTKKWSSAATFANIMCRQPLPPPLSPPSAKLMIMALEEYRYQSRRGIRVPKKWRSSQSDDVIFKKKEMKVLEMNEEGLRFIQNGDFYYEVEDSETKLMKETLYELLEDDQKKKLGKNNEANMIV
ncbi:ribosomal L18p/L5e family protein [Tanacetum coccineum]